MHWVVNHFTGWSWHGLVHLYGIFYTQYSWNCGGRLNYASPCMPLKWNPDAKTEVFFILKKRLKVSIARSCLTELYWIWTFDVMTLWPNLCTGALGQKGSWPESLDLKLPFGQSKSSPLRYKEVEMVPNWFWSASLLDRQSDCYHLVILTIMLSDFLTHEQFTQQHLTSIFFPTCFQNHSRLIKWQTFVAKYSHTKKQNGKAGRLITR